MDEAAAPAVPGRTIVFVTGLHRSGTSLLHRLLRAHPEVSGFENTGVWEDEGQHLQSVVPAARAFGGPGHFGFDPRACLDETSPLATPENAAAIYADWSRHWDADRRILLEKSPPTLVRMRFFQALFPGAVFVVLLRHPVAVAAATEKWARTGMERLIEHTLRCYEQAFDDLRLIRRAFVLRYEELVADPDAALRALCAFLGLDPVSAGEPVRRDVNAKYFARWRRNPLARRRRRALAEACEARALRFGYSLTAPETLRPLEFPGGSALVYRPGKGGD